MRLQSNGMQPKLVQQVDTRWYSHGEMYETFHKNMNNIENMFKKENKYTILVDVTEIKDKTLLNSVIEDFKLTYAYIAMH